jgi:hypothetical protein
VNRTACGAFCSSDNKIMAEAGKETVTFKISSKGLPSQIETKDDLNNYIGQLRTKLEVELDEGKTIIIE